MSKSREEDTGTCKKNQNSGVSTKEDSADPFFLQMPQTGKQNREDSFSFSRHPNDIFSPTGNFSCVKKETPKFGRAENQKSTPTRNMIRKLTAIRNQIRLQRDMENVLQGPPLVEDPLDFPTEERGLDFTRGSGVKGRRRGIGIWGKHSKGCLSKEKESGLNNVLQMDSSESIPIPFAERKSQVHKYQNGKCQKGGKNTQMKSRCLKIQKSSRRKASRSPKVLGKKIWEIFQSSKKHPQTLKNGIENKISTNQSKPKAKNFKSHRRTSSYKIPMSHRRISKEPATINGLAETLKSNLPFKNDRHWDLGLFNSNKSTNKLKAKKLPIEFQEEFRQDLLQCFKLSSKKKPKDLLQTPKWGTGAADYFRTSSKHRNRPDSHRKLQRFPKNPEKMAAKSQRKSGRISLRYQSAKKESSIATRDNNFGFSRRGNRNSGVNQFLFDELRFMMDSKKNKYVQNPKSSLRVYDVKD